MCDTLLRLFDEVIVAHFMLRPNMWWSFDLKENSEGSWNLKLAVVMPIHPGILTQIKILGPVSSHFDCSSSIIFIESTKNKWNFCFDKTFFSFIPGI